MTKDDQDTRALKLAQSIPATAVRQRSQGGASLSYVDGYYVFSQMNDIFGPEGWSYHIVSLTEVSREEQNGKTEVGYQAIVRLTAGEAYVTEVGYGSGRLRQLVASIEFAGKEAVTDAVKRCCKKLGPRTGLALYDKDQAGIDIGDIRAQIQAAETREQLETLRPAIREVANINQGLYDEAVACFMARSQEIG